MNNVQVENTSQHYFAGKGDVTVKKLINFSFGYAIAAMACGVFYREFTKAVGFTGVTALSFAHVHLFALLLALFAKNTDLTGQKTYRAFLVCYNIGLPFMTVMFLVRGVLQALCTELSSGASAAISGVAGLGHIIMAVALVLLFVTLRSAAKQTATKSEAQ